MFDYSRCMHRRETTVITCGRHFSEGEVWNNIQERLFCLECGDYATEAEVRAGWGQLPLPKQEPSHGNVDISSTITQLPLIDIAGGVSFPKERRKLKVQNIKVNDMFAQVRQLHEQINTYLHKCPSSERPSLNSPADGADLIRPFIANLDHEELWIILLNRRNAVTQLVRLYQGSVNSSQVRVGEIFRQAIIEQASAIVICHNHPSGDATPSPDDVAVTRDIVQAGKLLDIDVLDHLIVCNDRFVSLKERGLGFA